MFSVSLPWSIAGNEGQTNIALDGLEAEILDELLLEVLDDQLLCTDGEGLALCLFEILSLADIGEEADDLMALLEEPGKDAAGVEATGVGEEYFLFLSHCSCSW